VSQQPNTTDRPLSNREEIKRRLKVACEGLDEPYPGYRDHMYDVAVKVLALTTMHNIESLGDINKQIRDLLAHTGGTAHKAADTSGEVSQ
jgi:hypothetical protein